MDFEDQSKETRQWAMLLHLSSLISYSGLGVIVPILIWQIKKDDLPGLDIHGRIVANYLLTTFIIAALYGISLLLVVGLLLLPIAIPVMIIYALVFPIVGALKAHNGEAWHYPFMIRFF